jgi:hypothetical protein
MLRTQLTAAGEGDVAQRQDEIRELEELIPDLESKVFGWYSGTFT